jgi:hypothetical protein
MTSISKLIIFVTKFAMDIATLRQKNRINMAIFRLVAKKVFGRVPDDTAMNIVFSSLITNNEIHNLVTEMLNIGKSNENRSVKIQEINRVIESAARQVKDNLNLN